MEKNTVSVIEVSKVPKDAKFVRRVQVGGHNLRVFRFVKKAGDEGEVPFLCQENHALPGIVLAWAE